MLKSSERKLANQPISQPCFEVTGQPPASGISFEMKGGTMRFAPSSFLSAVDFKGSGALVFRYTFGTITVKGKALRPVWDALREGTLCRLCENRAVSSSEDPSVDTIALADFAEAQQSEPVFPEGGI